MTRRTIPPPDRPVVETDAVVVAGAGPLAPPPPPAAYVPATAGPSPTHAPSVSFAASGAPRSTPRSTPPPLGAEGHALVGVGPGLSGASRRAGLMSAYPFPITGAKIHPPLLRADTLSRPRLNDWLDRAATGRVVLIIAEAGFGKTTLLADWASRSSRRTAWYRLEPDDRDWLVFLRHLVAAGREIDPEFGTDTLELILGLGAGGPSQADVVASIVREYDDFASQVHEGVTLIVDDHHVIDGSAETDRILRALIDHTGNGLSIVIASRSAPRLPLGGLRSRGGLSRLDGADLRFDVPETDRLFREAYQRPLDPDVVDQLIKRTEGWAALLMLVRTSLEDKAAPEARALVAQLSAARGDLYDFLAEEVLASLSPALTHFLTRVSVLVSVDPETGALVVDRPASEVAGLIGEAEALGLLSRPDREAPHRFHPLVRDFLAAHLASEIGSAAVRDLHLRVAQALERTDWFGAAWHYRAADQPEDAARVIDAALPTILALGTVELSSEFLDGSAGDRNRAAALVLRSRLELSRDNPVRARELAETAAEVAGGSVKAAALLNLARTRSLWGFDEVSLQLASAARQSAGASPQASIADAFLLVGELTKRGDLQAGAESLRALAQQQAIDGLHWYRAITLLNLALALEWVGDLEAALDAAGLAEGEMARLGSRGVERAAVLVGKANVLAKLGRMSEAIRYLDEALAFPSSLARSEAAIEACRLWATFGDREAAAAAFASVDTVLDRDNLGMVQLSRGELAIRFGDLATAQSCSDELDQQPCGDMAGLMRAQILKARVAIASGDSEALAIAREAHAIATQQRSAPGLAMSELLSALAGSGGISDVIGRLDRSNAYLLSPLAEPLSNAAEQLTVEAWQFVVEEATRRPQRWREPFLQASASGSLRNADAAAQIGDEGTAARLRELAVAHKGMRPAALRITERLARPAYTVDLGRVELILGPHRLKIVRRKVLGLLCFLSSRPTMAATRDEVLEALWPELAPDTAGNSLHQTIYFLRRVFEPDYREGLSAGYVTYDGELVALSESLCDSLSRRCWRAIRRIPTDEGSLVELLELYRGRFALDFSYEDWAGDYRDNLHAAVLSAAETGIERRLSQGDFESAINSAHRILSVDPDADGIELLLLRAYKSGGRHAAAAEQYAHYAAVQRDHLGVNAPPLDEI
jgi:DNA-binding SARP family transcriptional activator